MKNIYFLVLLIALTGCAGIKQQPPLATGPAIFSYVYNNELTQLQKTVDKKIDIDALDQFGQTPLHHAMNHKNTAGRILLAGGANPNIQDRSGFTALHSAIYYKNSAMIIPLLQAGADIEALTFNKYKCNSYRTRKGRRGVNAIELAERCHYLSGISILKGYQSDTLAWQNAQQENSIAGYQAYLSQIKNPLFAAQAQKHLDEAIELRRIVLEQDQACQTKQDDWYLVEGKCRADLASGQGRAVTLDNKQFVGSFRAGVMVSGKIIVNGQMVWDGPLLEGKPDGAGICVVNSSPEECRYYHGERIDSLYKQRELMATHMAMLESKFIALQHNIGRQQNTKSTSDGSSHPLSYLADLNSKDGSKRTTAQIRAAVDLFKVLSD